MQYNIATSRQDAGRFSKGNWNMSFYQQLINEVDSLIRDKGKYIDGGYELSFNDLDEDEQAQLVVLCLEEDDRDATDCFHDASQYAKDDNVTCALIKMLKNITLDNQEDFAQAVLKNSIRNYSSRLNELFEDRCGWVTKNFHDSKGFDE
jgi:hypothetical protein